MAIFHPAFWNRRIAETEKLVNAGETVNKRLDLAAAHYCELSNEFAQAINWNGQLDTLTKEQLVIITAMVTSRGKYTNDHFYQQMGWN